MPTIKEVAQVAGVSIATVSYVLNNRNDMVGEKTREHVLQIAHDLGYRANVIARNLQSSRTNLIGYAWHKNPNDLPNLTMDQFIYSLAQATEAANYHLLTFTHPNDNPIAVYAELIQSGRVDGFVISGTEYNDPRIKFLIEKEFPFVSFGRANPDWDFHWVDTDGRAGMQLATEYLLELGHENIAFLGWPTDSLTGNDRLAGYLGALSDAGLPARDHLIIHNDYAQNSIDRAFSQWNDLPIDQRPSAIIAISDYIAVPAMRIAEQYGFRIGETLSIVGFDDAPFAGFLKPGLTTVKQPLSTITEHLINHLNDLIVGDAPTPKTRLIPPELVIRESTAPFGMR